MRTRGAPARRVVFRVAASGRIGFGHLVRALHLAEALRVAPRLSIRGSAAARDTARRLGARVVADARSVLDRGVDLLVIDDPSARAAGPWLRAARRRGLPVASFHDCGIAPLASDLAVDGSLRARRVPGLGAHRDACRLGADYSVLAPAVAAARRRARPRRLAIVIGLGGGIHAKAGLAIARRVRAALDEIQGLSRARVLLSLGIQPDAGHGSTGWPAGVERVAPEAFRDALATARVAVVAGGTTLYEACALGAAAVAAPVVPAQAGTVARFARAGLAVAPWRARRPAPVGSPRWSAGMAAAAVAVLADRERANRMAARARRAIDGQGAARVARAMDRLAGKDTRR